MFNKIWKLPGSDTAHDIFEIKKLHRQGFVKADTVLSNQETQRSYTVRNAIANFGDGSIPAEKNVVATTDTAKAEPRAVSISLERLQRPPRSKRRATSAASLSTILDTPSSAPSQLPNGDGPRLPGQTPNTPSATPSQPEAKSRAFCLPPSMTDELRTRRATEKYNEPKESSSKPHPTRPKAEPRIEKPQDQEAEESNKASYGQSAIQHQSAGFGSEAETLDTSAEADVVDFAIYGTEMQFIEIELDQSETVIAEPGAMTYMDPGVQMETIFGDGSKKSSGILGRLVSSGKRLLTGEGLFMTAFEATRPGKSIIAFASPLPGKIIALDLRQFENQIICQKDAFLCAAKGVSLDLFFQKKITTAFFGGAGFVLQRLTGDGFAFVHSGGSIIRKTLEEGETLFVDTGSIVCFTHKIDYSISLVRGIMTPFLGGEGFFLSKLTGPGEVWIQSLPMSRFASHMFSDKQVIQELVEKTASVKK